MKHTPKVLFICQHNSGRSQIAEAYLKEFAGDQIDVESAGYNPAERVNPLVVEVMKEEGIDISKKAPQSVFALYQAGSLYDHVITVCHDSEDQCPIFPGLTRRWHLPFPDPAKAEGTHEAKLSRVRDIRDMIKDRLLHPGKDDFSYKTLIHS